jgi:hypothetical protein
MELILTDAIGDWESEGGATTEPCGPLTNAMKSSSGKQAEQGSNTDSELARAEFRKSAILR